MAHDHDHAPADYNAAFAAGTGLNVLYVIVEAGYGFATGSLALVADAGHNLSDVVGLLLAWAAARLATRPPTPRRTYGLRRSSILAALGNAFLLLLAVGAIAWEAVRRLRSPEPVSGSTVMIVAGFGILINAATAALFARGRKSDINVEGAFLHMAADALVSVGVVLAGFVIQRTGLAWIDPVISLVVVFVVGWGTWGLLRRSLDMALDAVPEGIDPQEVRAALESHKGVAAVHDLHVWNMSTTEAALTAHVVAPNGLEDQELRNLEDRLHERFGIEHSTIQVEHGTAAPCPLKPEGVI